MPDVRSFFASLFATVFFLAPVSAQERDDVSVYIWGNSLVHHLSNTDATTMPHWLSRLARADGRTLALDGQWGFIRDFANTLPPVPNWSFKEVRSAWNSERTSFGNAGFDSVMITPANFIQYLAPEAPYDGDNPTNISPAEASLQVFRWVQDQGMAPRFFVYEGWAELGGFPPTRRAYSQFVAYAQDEYHAWFRDYVAALQAGLPGSDVRLIPVGSVIAGLVDEGPLAFMRPTDLYLDGAPHGTATTYFLAALISYASLYETPPPRDFREWDGLDERVSDSYDAVVDYVWAAVQKELSAETAAVAPAPETAPTEVAVAPAPAPEAVVTPQPVVPAAQPQREPEPVDVAPRRVVSAATPLPAVSQSDGVGLANPSLAMGLNGIADFSTQHPFIDVMKTARPWVGHRDGEWGAITDADLRAGGHLDENGWLVSVPPDATVIESFILTDQPAAATSLDARYRVTWDGRGDMTIGGIAQVDRMSQQEEGLLWFRHQPSGEGLVSITIASVDPADPIRNIEIVREDHIVLHEAGAIYNPDFVARIADLRSLRFMDWTFTNGSEKVTWDDRAKIDTYTYVGTGVPVEHIIHLSNLVGADPWVNMPHMADDDFMRRYAERMRDGLDPRLQIYVEYSNEVWNFIFPQAVHARTMAQERWGRRARDDAWMQWAGLRAAEMADIWADVFQGQQERLVPTIGVHSGWMGFEEPLLEAPLWVREGNRRPAERFKAYAVTGYFGFETGGDEYAPRIIRWIEDAGQDKAALNTRVADLLKSTSLPELTDQLWPYHARTAASYGMKMVMYEGGTHVAPHGDWSGNETLDQFMREFNYSPEMALIYRSLLEQWRDVGGTLFNAFVDIAPPSQFGSWGSLRHIDDQTSRWDALMAFNTAQEGWWEPRPSDAFLHGITLYGGTGADLIQGTTEEDILIGGTGDDSFFAGGRSDMIHGGPGNDVAVLPGGISEYDFTKRDGRVIATRGSVQVLLTEVEVLQFDDVAIDTSSF